MNRVRSYPQLNANVEWVNQPAFWTFYVCFVVIVWLFLTLVMSAGIAWTYVHLIHNVVTFYFLHWKKGTPVWDDQGKYKDLTFWEQVDGGSQFTRNKKMFTIIPVALFLIATNSCDFKKQPIFLNAASVVAVLIAKLPQMHKVRLLGINK